jgi:hypothetical protein
MYSTGTPEHCGRTGAMMQKLQEKHWHGHGGHPQITPVVIQLCFLVAATGVRDSEFALMRKGDCKRRSPSGLAEPEQFVHAAEIESLKQLFLKSADSDTS